MNCERSAEGDQVKYITWCIMNINAHISMSDESSPADNDNDVRSIITCNM